MYVPEQIEEWVIQSNISAGEWDWDALSSGDIWDETDLADWGLIPETWDITGDKETAQPNDKTTECPACGHIF